MKTKLLLLLISISLSSLYAITQVPQGVNYQAIARDPYGDPISSASLQVRFTILSDTLSDIIIWEEIHNPVQTNPFGLFSIVLGNGVRQVASQVPTFGDIDWGVSSTFLRTSIYYQSQWHLMGTSRLWSVPYAISAGDLSGSVKKLQVAGETTLPDEALFEVKNKNGQTVFAVYSEGVRINVGDGLTKSSKGGFAIGSFDETKVVRDYFVVNSDCVRVYIDNNPAKAVKGGFAIGSFDASKAGVQEYLRVTDDSTRINVSQSSKAVKGGFAIGSFDMTKGIVSPFTSLTPTNYFIGHRSGAVTTTGLYNSFVGYESGLQNTQGSYNSFFGYLAGNSNTTGSSNVFIGNESGKANTEGLGNTFMGYFSGRSNLTGNVNVFIGTLSGSGNTGGTANVFVGHNSGLSNSTGNYNTFLGYESGFANNASFNSFIGFRTGRSNTTGTLNSFIGYDAGYSNTTGNSNVFIGNQAGRQNTSGASNIFLGNSSGFSNSSGNQNIFLGENAGYNNTIGSQNVFLGLSAGAANQSGGGNVFIGWTAGQNNTTGFNNTFLGLAAGLSNTTSAYNTFVGNQAGLAATTGNFNSTLGYSAGRNIGAGTENVYLGSESGFSNANGSGNTMVGSQSGYNLSTGSGNIFIGSGAGSNLTNASNRLFIHNNAANFDNALIYGEFDNSYLRLNANTDIYGRLGVGKASASARVDIAASNWDVLNSEGDLRIGDGSYRFKIGVSMAGGGAGDVRMTAHGGTNRLILGGGGKEVLSLTATQIYPWTDNAFSLGLSSHRWTTVYAVNGTINTSDARLKTNIEDLGYGIEKIMKLRPVSFNWRDNPDGKRILGLLAQDVNRVIEEVVDRGTDPIETLGINYSELIPVLIKGMQEQQQIIDKQAEELNSLRSRLELIEAAVITPGNK